MKETYNKYHNKKTEIDGVKFDSTMESEYYLYLKDLKEKGIVIDFEMQVKYLLQEKFKYKNTIIREINYIADFKVYYADKHEEVVDIKGQVLNDFKLKRKMLIFRYPNIDFRCLRSKGRKPNKIWEQIL